MLSIDFIRKNQDLVTAAAKNKNRKIELEKILSLDDERREIIQQTQTLREERNKLAKTNNPEEARTRGKELKEALKEKEDRLAIVELDLDTLVSFVPNIPLDEVPVGKSEEDNVEIKKWGEIPKLEFTPKSHIDLGLNLDLFDLEKGTKVSGFRGYFLKNQLAILQFAVLFYGFLKLSKKGYTPMIAPSIVKGFTLFGSGQFPWGEQEVYRLNDEDAYLAGTAEVPVTAYHSGEILNEKDLPKKFVAFSPCFRREAGSYGKDTKGLYRVHEFWKIEQVIIGNNNIEDAKALHEELQANTEEILQDLKIPYSCRLFTLIKLLILY